MAREKLQGLTREELIARAEAAGVSRPRSLTHAELVDELVLRGDAPAADKTRARGWFGRAKDLLKTAIERGLTRSDGPSGSSSEEGATSRPAGRSWPPAPPPPLPTVTLAEIYAAQGHLERAVQVLDEVLAKAPDHGDARRLRAAYAERIEHRVVARPRTDGEAADDADDGGASASASKVAPKTTEPKAARPIPPPPPSIGGPSTQLPVDDADELDEIVAVAVDPTTIYLYWEVRPTTAARARIEAPHGALTVRTITVIPAEGGPLSDVRDDRVDALAGDLFVRGVRDGSHVRVSIGWRTESAFVPLAVAVEVSTPRGAPSADVARELTAWAPPKRGGGLRPRLGSGAPRPLQAGITSGEEGFSAEASAGGAGFDASPPTGNLARRRILLQPTEVFTVSASESITTTYVTRLVGSSDLLVSVLEGRVGRVVRHGLGGASDLAPGASDLLLR